MTNKLVLDMFLGIGISWKEGVRRCKHISNPDNMEPSPYSYEESGWEPASPTFPTYFPGEEVTGLTFVF